MTIDEAIENLEQDVEIDMYIHDIAPQLAEWLEDYKRLKSIPEHNYYNCHNLTCRRKCEKDGYNKAVDDFLEGIQWEYLNGCGIKQSEIDFLIALSSEVAERLKRGDDNDRV